jgi:hypothetical protein
MTPEQRAYNGDRAREILENEVYQQVFADLKTEITEQWTNSPARDEEGREKLWLMLSLANKLQAMLQTTLDTGKLARLDLEHQRTLAQKAKRLVGMR